MRILIQPAAGGASALLALLALAPAGRAQQRIRVADLPPASATSIETIGSVIGIRQLPDGRVLVDDGERRQLRLFDASLAASSVVLDSVPGISNSYGRRPSPLVAYLADSTLFPDYAARALLVIDPAGRVTRTLALPNPNDVGLVTHGAAVDPRGRLIYLGSRRQKPGAKPGEKLEDSLPILRADLDLRRTDTIGALARPLARTAVISPDGRSTVTAYVLDPLRTIDEWSVLSDGSVGIVRGHDYHVDWIRPDGTMSPSAKLPFDWKRIEDADKQRIVDSTQTKLEQSLLDGSFVEHIEQLEVMRNPGAAPPIASGGGGGGGGRGAAGGRGGGSDGRSPGNPFQGFVIAPREVIPLDQIADYYPAIRSGAVTADLDDNLWILPTTSTQSKTGELVYDVVDAKGELFERVRLPLGRLLVGFARNGVVYMVSGDRASGFHLERTTLPARGGSSR
jgi:hypothetical protein